MLASVSGPKATSLLARELDSRGIRYGWFARNVLGISPFTFSRIENGHQPPPAGHYEKAALYLHLPLQALLPDAKEAAAA